MSLSKLTVIELRKKLRSQGLPTSGRKQELIDRLLEDDPEESGSSSSEEESLSARQKKRARETEPAREAVTKRPRRSTASQKKGPDIDVSEHDLEWSFPDGDRTFCVLSNDETEGRKKIVALDYDHTVGVPKSGRKFANGVKDWVWWHAQVPTVLRKYHDDGYKVVFFTNQAGVEKHKTTIEVLQGKFADLIKTLGFPVHVFIAGATNHWRKPHTRMWRYLVERFNGPVEVDLEQCLYVGDAAGREKGWKPNAKRDFSASDRKFAANIGITFKTPEEFFLKHPPTKKWSWRGIDPRKILSDCAKQQEFEGKGSIASSKQELVVSVGLPASGKSSFAKRHLVSKGYVWINRDTLKTPARCLKACKEALAQGKSVVVDNTSPSQSARLPYIKAAKDAGVPVRCFWFQTDREIASHLNMYREAFTDGGVRRVPDVAYNVFRKNFQEPSTDEGFKDVCTVQFVPHFDSEDHKQMFLERM